MAVLAVVDELVFRTKIEAAASQLGVTVRVTADAAAARSSPTQGRWSLVIIDLGLAAADAIALIRAIRQDAPAIPIVGYCSHIDVELQRRAIEAGCASVLPRSAFVQRLPELLAGK